MWDKLREQLQQLGIQQQLEDELRTGIALQHQRAEREQIRLAQIHRANPRRGLDGIGQTRFSMNPFFRALADVRFGKGWAKDKATVRKLLAEHPEFAVPYAKRAQVSVLSTLNSQLSTSP